MSTEIYYEQDSKGGFLLVFDGEVFGPYESIGISYDVTDGYICLLKHGDYRKIKAWHEKYKKLLTDGGFPDVAADLRLVEICHCSLEDLNHFIGTSSLPEKWIEKLQPIAVSL